MDRIRQKFLQLVKKHLGTLLLILFGAVCIVFLVFSYKKPFVKTSYQSQIIEDITNTSIGIEYTYYLDFTPSMLGYFQTNNGSMAQLAEILKTINQASGNNNFYQCAEEIDDVESEDFYDGMISVEQLLEHYTLENVLEQLNKLNLADIFTKKSHDQNTFSLDEKELNVIITDFNFTQKTSEGDDENLYLENFKEELLKKGSAANIGIYQIESNFSGINTDTDILLLLDKQNDLETESSGAVGEITDFGNEITEPATAGLMEDRTSVFFVLVLSKTNNIYNNYIERLENQLDMFGITYDKYELKNVLWEDQIVQCDINKWMEDGLINVSNLNYDNKSFRNLPDNGIGFCSVNSFDSVAAVEMPVFQYITMNLGEEERERLSSNTINIKTLVFYLNRKTYRRYNGTGIFNIANAQIRQFNNEWYLYTELEWSINESFRSALEQSKQSSKQHFVIEIQYYIEQPDYNIPDWINQIDSKKIGNLFTQLAEAKKEAYADNVDERQRYIGSLIIYVKY